MIRELLELIFRNKFDTSIKIEEFKDMQEKFRTGTDESNVIEDKIQYLLNHLEFLNEVIDIIINK